MAKAEDFNKYVTEMLSAFPMDNSALTDAFKTSAAIGEKMSKVAIDAAEKSTEISSKWTKETLAKLGDVTTVKDEPTDYTKAMTDFASAQAELASENLAAFAEVAKKVQMETVELMLAAGKEVQEETTAAVKKAAAEASSVAKMPAAAK